MRYYVRPRGTTMICYGFDSLEEADSFLLLNPKWYLSSKPEAVLATHKESK